MNTSKHIKIATAVAGLGATAALAGLGAGTAAADTAAGVADGCYEAISSIALPPAMPGTGTKIGTAHVKDGTITAFGQRGRIKPTPTGGTAHVGGVTVRLTAKTIGADGDTMTVYRVDGVPGIALLTPTC
ncbi:hypothetical protein [Gordonia neofelifaecis]|uniref:Uncharacterized protein n=1 Tax=Gordonia neofelifaecis NRRL B-59395 TaxID=644548 RepID=F1YE63_9ACTN|nr:hypothetical protein [Gordonia neofelifaecis]EGD57153.1 hypothetical protein SCNU_02225 [Gordonia neofelifaecis NRRL B-59395]